jgi:hypothetical protein
LRDEQISGGKRTHQSPGKASLNSPNVSFGLYNENENWLEKKLNKVQNALKQCIFDIPHRGARLSNVKQILPLPFLYRLSVSYQATKLP